VSLDHNPQAEQMGDESMARNLAHQAQAIWPQEILLFDRYGLSGDFSILDVGCGTGEITRRLAQRYPQARLLGLDILEGNLRLARRDSEAYGERIRYETGDAFALKQADASVDLLVCRHMSQAVPEFPRVLAEFRRVLRPGGWLHLLSEDYGMLHMAAPGRPALRGTQASCLSRAKDPDRFWNTVVVPFLAGLGCDGRIGRHSPTLLAQAGFEAIAMHYVTVDTLRVPRATFAGILEAWKDGYSPALAESSGRSLEDVQAEFDAILDSIRIEPNYAVWHVPVACGRRP
jgi:ubiquinone/menaquinone biosynthesis C-methylase UbiE